MATSAKPVAKRRATKRRPATTAGKARRSAVTASKTSKTRQRSRPRSARGAAPAEGGDPARDGERRWSARVTRDSSSLDLEPGVFKHADPVAIARSLKRSADRSTRRKTDPYRSAMSMLTFYLNRAGRNVGDKQRRVLERAKDELRRLYGREAKG